MPTQIVQDFLEHLSQKPWSEYKESDYSLEQWHKACLIHQHEGDPTSKAQCKLPVKTPHGALNLNGVYAASAALAGARSEIKATREEKAKAARALTYIYDNLKKKPPESIVELTHSSVDDFLEHYGVRGMKWGQRRAARNEAHINRLTRVATNQPLSKKEGRQVYRKYGIHPSYRNKSAMAQRQLDIIAKRKERHDKTVAFIKSHGKGIAITSGVVAGTIGVGLLLRAHQNVKVNQLRQSHGDFMKAKDLLDSKMSRRMSSLQDLAKQTPPGHPSHQGAQQEIKNLREFYSTQLNKMISKNGLDASTLSKMKVKPVI